MATDNFKCRFCRKCMGFGCTGELPGMGGVDGSRNFKLNCAAWNRTFEKLAESGKRAEIEAVEVPAERVGIAPVTGAEENIGFAREKDFYLPYFTAAHNCGINICIGDGFPDEKLKLGIDAARTLKTDAYVFFKPYPDSKLHERFEITAGLARAVGMDIDAYNIATMRNLVQLEKKTPEQISALRRRCRVPFMLKGIFTPEDIELCRTVKPDIIVVSNHGGRIDTLTGSTADFLEKHAAELSGYCGELWVDGGIRTHRDAQTALYLGAKRILAARPFIRSLCHGGISEMTETVKGILGTQPL